MPSNKSQPKIFYGWWIVGACFVFSFYIGGGVFYGFTTIFEPIVDEFHWSYAQVSLAASLRGVEIGLLAPVVGLLVDRWGPRRLMFIGALLAGSGLILLSRVNSLPMFYVAFFVISLGMSASSSTVLMTGVANWFHQRVSLVAGITISGFGLGGLLVPVIVGLIDIFDWRTAMVIWGLGAWALCAPISLLVRHKPEQYGYLPDGETIIVATPDEAPGPAQIPQDKMSLKQALTNKSFWHIALAQMFLGMAIAAVVTHVMPYLSSIGIARSISGQVAAAIPLVSIGGRLGFGWLGDKYEKKWIAVLGFALAAAGLLFFGAAPGRGIWFLVIFIILFSFGYGGNNTMRIALVQEHFGRAKFGTVHGFIIGLMMAGQIIGAPLAGWTYDTWGSYQGIWFIFAALTFIAVIIMSTTPPARRLNPKV
ncbi:MAG: MFS transporter [Chloroflexi bacterium]|nr:MFS transporter [Chloroflexota bacterium]